MRLQVTNRTPLSAICQAKNDGDEERPFRLHAPGVPKDTFMVVTWNSYDFYLPGGSLERCAQRTSWIASVIQADATDDHATKPPTVQDKLCRDYGILISYKRAW